MIGDAAHFLDLTEGGRVWMANLYAHVFAAEHGRRRMGSYRG
uniref:Metal-dependent phosphohydrolase HD region n=1 Tax=Methylobacterium oryzae CBMB20 TaxID=693986 RepID=A0A088B321_9HYPH|nr:Metal-dependent phosphohydrolase HD region [Methylobacterium oryzae CBMB20]